MIGALLPDNRFYLFPSSEVTQDPMNREQHDYDVVMIFDSPSLHFSSFYLVAVILTEQDYSRL